MIRVALRNGLLGALLLMFAFFKYLDWSTGWTTAQPITYPSARGGCIPIVATLQRAVSGATNTRCNGSKRLLPAGTAVSHAGMTLPSGAR